MRTKCSSARPKSGPAEFSIRRPVRCRGESDVEEIETWAHWMNTRSRPPPAEGFHPDAEQGVHQDLEVLSRTVFESTPQSRAMALKFSSSAWENESASKKREKAAAFRVSPSAKTSSFR